MKRISTKTFALTTTLFFAACGGTESDDDGANNTLDVPQTVVRSGALVDVDGTPSATGAISIRTDGAGKRYVYLGPDFVQAMGPGDTELRLAKGSGNVADQIAADASNVSVAIGVIPNASSGAFLFEVPSNVDDTAFGFAVVWCPTAGVNFGVASFGGTGNRMFSAALTNVDGTPSATGSVTIRETGAGMFTLELGADFAQAMGPGDTEIRLAKGDDNIADQISADANSVSASLGIVPNGASGAMSFTFSQAEPSDFGYVVIWCPTAGVNFGVGDLSAVAN